MGPAILIIPLALVAILGAAAASKKKQALPATTSTAQKQPASIPADIQAMVTSAITSGNPETQRRVAAAIRSRYPAQADFLDDNASKLEPVVASWGTQTIQQAANAEAVQAGKQAAIEATAAGASPVQAVQAAQTAAAGAIATTSPGIIPAPAPIPPGPSVAQVVAATIASPNVAIPAAQQAATNAIAAGATPAEAIAAAQTAAVQAVTPPSAAARPEPLPAPMPRVAPTVADSSGRGLAADMAKALSASGVKKGTKTEPRGIVEAYQTQERLTQNDGSYGYETAMSLADRYGIVPPKPLYWGKKGGPPSLPAQQKQAYSAHLLVLASKDPPRADEWRAAAKV